MYEPASARLQDCRQAREELLGGAAQREIDQPAGRRPVGIDFSGKGPADDPVRRASQTVCFELLTALTRLMAPILTFTADEVWMPMRRPWASHSRRTSATRPASKLSSALGAALKGLSAIV